MADNAIKKIKTSCPFPMLLYKASVRYNEVRKASGIAYILLELIQKSVMGKENCNGAEGLRYPFGYAVHICKRAFLARCKRNR